MKEKIAYILFFIFSLLGVFMACIDCLSIAIVYRILGLSSLGYIYYLHEGFSDKLFYVGLFVIGIAESLIVIGFEYYKFLILINIIIYYWITFFIIKKNATSYKTKFDINRIIPVVISFFLLLYLIKSFLSIISSELINSMYLVYINICSYTFLIIYMGFIYYSNRSFRNFWLLPTLICILITQATIPLESLYYHSKYLKSVGFLAEIGSHFFFLKFLITPEDGFFDDKEITYL